MKKSEHILESIANANSMIDLLNQLPQSTLIQRDVYVELSDLISNYLREIRNSIDELIKVDPYNDDRLNLKLRELYGRKMVADQSASTGCII